MFLQIVTILLNTCIMELAYALYVYYLAEILKQPLEIFTCIGDA